LGCDNYKVLFLCPRNTNKYQCPPRMLMVEFSVYAEIDDTIRVNYLKMVIEVKTVQGRTLVYIIGPSEERVLPALR
jgi:hypothetical protein